MKEINNPEGLNGSMHYSGYQLRNKKKRKYLKGVKKIKRK